MRVDVSPVPRVRFHPKENNRLTSFGRIVIYENQNLLTRLTSRQKLEAEVSNACR